MQQPQHTQVGAGQQPQQGQPGVVQQPQHTQIGVVQQPQRTQVGVVQQPQFTQVGVMQQPQFSQVGVVQQAQHTQVGVVSPPQPTQMVGGMQQVTYPQAGVVQQPQMIYPVPPSTSLKPVRREKYQGKTSMVLGSLQVAVGVLCIILQVIALCTHVTIAANSSGIYCGILFVLAGVFGILAGKKKTNCFIVTFMVLSIVSTVFVFIIIGFSAAAIGIDSHDYRYHYYDNYNDYNDYGSGRYRRKAPASTQSTPTESSPTHSWYTTTSNPWNWYGRTTTPSPWQGRTTVYRPWSRRTTTSYYRYRSTTPDYWSRTTTSYPYWLNSTPYVYWRDKTTYNYWDYTTWTPYWKEPYTPNPTPYRARSSGYYSYYVFHSDRVAISSILIVLALFELVVAIWSSALACAGLCCTDTHRNRELYQAPVHYQVMGNQAPFVTIQPTGAPNQQPIRIQGFVVNQSAGNMLQGMPSGQQAMVIPNQPTTYGTPALQPTNPNLPPSYTWATNGTVAGAAAPMSVTTPDDVGKSSSAQKKEEEALKGETYTAAL